MGKLSLNVQDTKPVQYLSTLKEPRIDSKESIPPAVEAWRLGMSKRVVAPACHAGWKLIPGLPKRSTNTGSAGREGVVSFSCQVLSLHSPIAFRMDAFTFKVYIIVIMMFIYCFSF